MLLVAALVLALVGGPVAVVVAAADDAPDAAPTTADAASDTVSLYSFSLSPPYIDENLNNRYWDFGGDTLLEVNKFVRMTQDRPAQDGWIWSKQPLNARAWQVEFEFAVHGKPGVVHGDGFAFWYTMDRAVEGPVFGSKDQFQGLGVFFDTYPNGRHPHAFPYVNAMVGDGKTPYDHATDGVSNEIGGCSLNFRNKNWPTRARVRYVPKLGIKVDLVVRSDGVWESCFEAPAANLTAGGYLGFTAWTGDVSDAHDLLRVDTYSLLNTDQLLADAPSSETITTGQKKMNRKKEASGGRGGRGFVGSLLFVVVVAGVLLAVYYFLRVNQNQNYKRF